MEKNLIEALQDQLKRNESLVEMYGTIPTGVFAKKMIQIDIDRARDALNTLDTVGMLESLESLRGNE